MADQPISKGAVGGERHAEGERRPTAGRRAERIEVLNPANGATIGSVAVDSAENVAETVARVRGNQAEWEALGIDGRYRWLGELRDWLFDNHERVLDTMQAETGKVRGDTTAETFYLTDLINFYGTKAAKFIGDETVRPHSALAASKKLIVQYRPHPVVGVISPWNFPLALALGDAIPALQAGAAVVVKPSEFTPLGLAEIVEAWKRRSAAPTCSTACSAPARPAAPWSTTSTSSSSPARTAPAAR